MGSCSDVAPTIARLFLGRSPATRPITAPADGSAYGSQTPGVVQRNSHPTMSAGAAWSANEQTPIGKGRGMTDRRGSARMVAMTMATLGLAAGVLVGVVMLPSLRLAGNTRRLSTTPISLRPCRVHRRQEEFFSPCKLSLQVMEQRGPHHGTAFPRCSPKRPINVPADGSAYGSQTPGVVLRSSHSISAGAAWSANE